MRKAAIGRRNVTRGERWSRWSGRRTMTPSIIVFRFFLIFDGGTSKYIVRYVRVLHVKMLDAKAKR